LGVFCQRTSKRLPIGQLEPEAGKERSLFTPSRMGPGQKVVSNLLVCDSGSIGMGQTQFALKPGCEPRLQFPSEIAFREEQAAI
jgi:hypothetical protein